VVDLRVVDWGDVEDGVTAVDVVFVLADKATAVPTFERQPPTKKSVDCAIELACRVVD